MVVAQLAVRHQPADGALPHDANLWEGVVASGSDRLREERPALLVREIGADQLGADAPQHLDGARVEQPLVLL